MMTDMWSNLRQSQNKLEKNINKSNDIKTVSKYLKDLPKLHKNSGKD